MLRPKLFSTLKTYNKEKFYSDLISGAIVGIVALPLAIAFAIASGVKPSAGLWTAVIAGFIISVLGGSRVQIGGPSGSFVVIVYGIIQQHGMDGLVIATLMAGVMLVAFGLLGLGGAIKFVPHPLITGFTSGIALIIFSSQVRDFLGLSIDVVPADFLPKMIAYGEAMHTIRWESVLTGIVALSIILWWPRISRKVPGSFIALVVTTLAVQLLNLPVDTIGSRFGEINGALPSFRVPWVGWNDLAVLIRPAFTIALLIAVESLLSAVVADGMIGARHRSNMELVAQGGANLIAPLFGGIPATGALARTATNVKNGGRTPIAGIVHVMVLLLITVAFGKWASLIPMPALAAVLVVVSYHMFEWRRFVSELKSHNSDVVVLLSTFFLTVLVDLTVAMEVGMILAAFLFIRRIAAATDIQEVTNEFKEDIDDYDTDPYSVERRQIPKGVEVYEINGPFFFGAAESFKEALGTIADKPKIMILRMRNVPVIDLTGVNTLKEIVQRFQKDGTTVLISGIQPGPRLALEESPAIVDIGEENIFDHFDDALTRARSILGLPLDLAS